MPSPILKVDHNNELPPVEKVGIHTGLKVFIASPYTIGDTAINARIQMDAFNFLLDHGFFPVAPLWAHFQHSVHPRPYQDWIQLALTQLANCDVLYRIVGGYSGGADNEVSKAVQWQMPVYESLEQLFFDNNVQIPLIVPDFWKNYYVTDS